MSVMYPTTVCMFIYVYICLNDFFIILCHFIFLFSGIPETVPVNTVNRQCSSGLQAFMNVAGGIKNGVYDMAIAAG